VLSTALKRARASHQSAKIAEINRKQLTWQRQAAGLQAERYVHAIYCHALHVIMLDALDELAEWHAHD
jgi:hypothetical protein